MAFSGFETIQNFLEKETATFASFLEEIRKCENWFLYVEVMEAIICGSIYWVLHK